MSVHSTDIFIDAITKFIDVLADISRRVLKGHSLELQFD
jgi:hypothetical protein